MNAPFNLFSGLTDRLGKNILIGNKVRKYDYVMLGNNVCEEFVEGTVVFENGSYRICISQYYDGRIVDLEERRQGLTQHYTLLFDQILGTKNVEVIS